MMGGNERFELTVPIGGINTLGRTNFRTLSGPWAPKSAVPYCHELVRLGVQKGGGGWIRPNTQAPPLTLGTHLDGEEQTTAVGG